VEGDAVFVTAASAAASDLSEIPAFSKTITDLHPGGAANRALVLTADTGATGVLTRFIRYVDSVPLSSFGRLSFYLDASGPASGSTLKVAVGDGTGDGAEVTIDLDAFDLVSDGWCKVELRLNPAAPIVTFTASDGSAFSVPGTVSGFSIPGSAGLVEISVAGLTSGTVAIDEIILEEPADGFSSLLDASFKLGDPTKKVGVYAKGKASGVLDADIALAGAFEAGLKAPFVSAIVDASPSYADGTGALGLGYQLAFPSSAAPTRIQDRYSRDEASGRYARKLEGAIAAGTFSGTAAVSSAEEPGAFSQEWKGNLGLGSVVSLSAQAGLAAPVSVLSGMGFSDAWLESWRLAVPAAESDANSRRFEFAAAAFDSKLVASASHAFASGSPAGTEFSAKATAPFKLGVLNLSPFYIRESSVERLSVSASFEGDALEFAQAAADAAALWSAVPVDELWNRDAFAGFGGFSSGASSGTHTSGLGLGIQRPIGFGILDLIVPSAVETGFYRKETLQYDTGFESDTMNISLAGAAANVFASGGAKPILSSIAFDEYSYKTQFDFTYYPSDGFIMPTVNSNVAISFEALSGSMLAFTNGISYQRTRSAQPWSESLGLALATKPRRTWFGDLVGLLIRARDTAKPAGEGESEPATEATWVSAWLDTVLAVPPALRETFTLEGSIGRSSALGAPLVLLLAFDYSTKAIAAGSLNVGFGAGLSQTLSMYEGSVIWGMAYELSIMAKVVF